MVLASVLLVGGMVPTAMAGDCTARDSVDWHATMASAIYVRNNCPTGDIIGTAPAGEMVSIKEVDKHGDFYFIESSVGSGFVYKTALKDIVMSPLPGKEPVVFENSVFKDLNPEHMYYAQIADVKAKGIVGGNPDGTIQADEPIVRAALAKILVEATTEDDLISGANLEAGLYSDANLNEWYAPYLALARDKGIMTGDGNTGGKTTVRPGANSSGAEVAKMIAVAFDLEVREKKAWEEWYAPYMEALEEKQALPFAKASHVVTRGEMMFMVSTVLENL